MLGEVLSETPPELVAPDLAASSRQDSKCCPRVSAYDDIVWTRYAPRLLLLPPWPVSANSVDMLQQMCSSLHIAAARATMKSIAAYR